jgi:ribonuclease BN (tRNA processing enzyme)
MKIHVIGFWGLGTVGETTCFMIEDQGTKILIDASPNLTRQLSLMDEVFTDVSGILLTHVHADHLQGLPYALFTRSVQARDADEVAPLQIRGNQETISGAQEAMGIFYPGREFDVSWENIEGGDSFDIGSLSISTLEVDHAVPTMGYRIESDDGKVVTFSGDTLPSDELIEFASGSDVLIQEAFGTEEDYGHINEDLGHSLASDAGRIATQTGVPKMVLFHMHGRYSESENREKLMEEVKSEYDGEVVFPTELQTIEL